MNYKILGLLALVVTALVALPAVAQATTVTSPTGTVVTGNKEGESEGHVKLANPISKIECNSKLNGPIETHGAGVTAGGKVAELSWTNCTNSWHVTTLSAGTLIVHYTSGYNGTVTSTGAEVTLTRLGINCVYATNATDVGTLTGGKTAVLDISATIPVKAGESSALCGSSAAWTGRYQVTTPDELYVDA